METTKSIQQLLFRTIDSLEPDELEDPAMVHELLFRTALERSPYLYDTLCQQIDMLVTEYCGAES
jgi:hypothetical protein